MSDLEEFRAEVRAWLEDNCPEEMRQPLASDAEHVWGGRRWQFSSEAQRVWFERMVAKGWTAPAWPVEYGGGGMSADEHDVFKAEMKRINARSPVSNFGFWMLGPALLKFGSEEQKRKHLPEIARGEIRWCQGYSEPNAGSDLASLKTSAEIDGDHFVVNGRKIWTSYADRADKMFCLVRTDPDAKKQAGISFILLDMDTPGVSTRPIQLISGESPFCETFFDDVRVPRANLVGEMNQGWTIAKYLLTHERDNIGGEPPGLLKGRDLAQMALQAVGADDQGRLDDPMLRSDIARLEIDAMAFRALVEQTRAKAEAGEGMGARSAMLKYYGTELNKRRYNLMMDAMGGLGLEWESEQTGGGRYAREWLRSKGNSIEGGTSEIMLGIISSAVLELPKG
ncbi:acyl-CoA dehydrogenase family protein [Endozoicomonas sp. G2_2]|uniref:acyl-CoA dehydrogenase family protein n=1 Tax=Endozoicomonas sp. G2_2 TaxID=2821092 RepID=UPI001ADBA441|nr:acyl-CoA dehydrogenase family protein [Endozoicomonas sp. G2_2]MBO9470871.1 acyl-CoA dehydrogenase family protein [Endozoicomonas sp. G2_2]